jgi:hypothetical protein
LKHIFAAGANWKDKVAANLLWLIQSCFPTLIFKELLLPVIAHAGDCLLQPVILNGAEDVRRKVAEREQYIWRSVLEGFTFGLLLATFVQVISADINTESGISVMAEQLQRQ